MSLIATLKAYSERFGGVVRDPFAPNFFHDQTAWELVPGGSLAQLCYAHIFLLAACRMRDSDEFPFTSDIRLTWCAATEAEWISGEVAEFHIPSVIVRRRLGISPHKLVRLSIEEFSRFVNELSERYRKEVQMRELLSSCEVVDGVYIVKTADGSQSTAISIQ